MKLKQDQIEREFSEQSPKSIGRVGCSKYHKFANEYERKGRFYRGERKYHRGKDHSGKGRTLRSHRGRYEDAS